MKKVKKLSLQRDTLRKLNAESLERAKGGTHTETYTYQYCATTDCITVYSQCVQCPEW